MMHYLIEEELMKLASVLHLENLNICPRSASLILTSFLLRGKSFDYWHFSGRVAPNNPVVGGIVPAIYFID